MKRAQVELAAEALPRLGAQLEEFELAELIRKRLARPRDVAVDFALHVRLVHSRVLMEVVDHLLPRPMLVVDAGIDHEPDRAPHLVLESAIVAVWVLIEPYLFAESLGVEGPAFDECGVAAVLAELRQVGQLLRERQL